MDEILAGFLDDFVIVYVDDILIYSDSWKEHVAHVRQVAERLKVYGIQVNMSKSCFGKEKTVYCGFVVENGQVSMDPSKVEVIRNWPSPENAPSL